MIYGNISKTSPTFTLPSLRRPFLNSRAHLTPENLMKSFHGRSVFISKTLYSSSSSMRSMGNLIKSMWIMYSLDGSSGIRSPYEHLGERNMRPSVLDNQELASIRCATTSPLAFNNISIPKLIIDTIKVVEEKEDK